MRSPSWIRWIVCCLFIVFGLSFGSIVTYGQCANGTCNVRRSVQVNTVTKSTTRRAWLPNRAARIERRASR